MIQQPIQYADAHTHLQDCQNYKEVIEQAQQAGVCHIVCNSTTLNYLPNDLTNQHPLIIRCIGVHPWFIPEEQIDYDKMDHMLEQDELLQVGEIGLDFAKAREKDQQKIQVDLFIKQMELGIKYNRTISIHCVRASGEMLKLMKKILKQPLQFNSAIIMHSYNCSQDITKAFDKLYPHFYYSFSMNIANKMEMLNYIDKQKLLFETDTPHQYNELIAKSDTQQSHPKYIKQLIDHAQIHLNEPSLAQIVFANFRRAFKLIQLQK